MKKNKVLIGMITFLVIFVFGGLHAKTILGSSEYLVSRGQKYLTELNYEKAILSFEKAIEIDSKNVEAYLGIADAYSFINNNEMAEYYLNLGLEELVYEQQLSQKLEQVQEVLTNNVIEEANEELEMKEDIVEVQEVEPYVWQDAELVMEKLFPFALASTIDHFSLSDINELHLIDIGTKNALEKKRNHPDIIYSETITIDEINVELEDIFNLTLDSELEEIGDDLYDIWIYWEEAYNSYAIMPRGGFQSYGTKVLTIEKEGDIYIAKVVVFTYGGYEPTYELYINDEVIGNYEYSDTEEEIFYFNDNIESVPYYLYQFKYLEDGRLVPIAWDLYDQ